MTQDYRQEAALLQWNQALLATTNPAFYPYYEDQHRYLVLMGGGGSGKSIFAGRKLLERAIREPGHRFLVCRKVAKTLQHSCFRQLLSQLETHYPEIPVHTNQTELRIRLPESEILFTGLDDAEKLKSIYGVTGIWIEEASELTEQDFSQLDIRLRGETKYYKQIILSFNPISALHWLKRRFFDQPDPRACTHRSTYRDNRFLDADAIRTLEAFRDTDPYYYAVYCLGQWGVTGRTVFPAAAVQARLSNLLPPTDTGLFAYDYDGLRLRNIRWQSFPDGYIFLYCPPKPGVPYVIGADTAGEGSDWFAAQVLDNRTGEQAAVFRRQHMDEDEFVRQLYCLGQYYHRALIGVETNFSSYPVRELERLHYPRQYVREDVDTYTHRPKPSFGFRTDARTRPVAISALLSWTKRNLPLLHDRATLEEMLTFVRSESGRPEAELGAHDDCILSLAIAHQIRPQERQTLAISPQSHTHWTPDMWQDWQEASTEERRYLENKWQ